MAEYICPNCKKPIYDDEALLCLYCGESLRRGRGLMGKIKYPTSKTIAVITIIFILMVFVLFMLR